MMIFLVWSQEIFASGSAGLPRTRLSAHQSLYSGSHGKSFSESSPGFGIGITALISGRYIVPTFGLKGGLISGRQKFLDNTTEVEANFSSYHASSDLGLLILPIERRNLGINVYFSGGGIASYHFVSLAKSTTLASIPHNDQNFSGGYYIGVGSEWILSNSGSNKWNLHGEILYRSQTVNLLKRQFDVSNMMMSIGIGW